MRRIDLIRTGYQHRIPRRFKGIFVLYPDSDSVGTGDAIHSRIAAEQVSIHQQGDGIRRMPGGEEDLTLQGMLYLRKIILIQCDDLFQMRFAKSWIAMLSVSDKGHQLAEQESEQRAASAIKAVLSPA